MPEDIFDVGLTLLVKSKIVKNEETEKIATQLSLGYSQDYSSENPNTLKSQWLEAASEVYDAIIKLEIDDKLAVAYCDYRKHFCTNFYRNGEKRGMLNKVGGTFFHKGTYDPQRAKNSAQSFISFCIICKNGTAKPEWIA